MPTIRVEEDVFAGLQKLATPFTDTPNIVIRRLLEEKGVLVQDTPPAPSAPKPNVKAKGKLVGQSTYEKYLLHVLAMQFKGKGTKSDVSKAVIDLMESRGLLSALEHEVV